MMFDLNYNKKVNMSMISNAKHKQTSTHFNFIQQNVRYKTQNNQQSKLNLHLPAIHSQEQYSEEKETCEIPLHIYQTWHSKTLPPKMQQCVNTLKKQNPEFIHHLYDDGDCYKFIRNNYHESVSNAYVSLIPGAYKADLWRYCILYKTGGIYLDIKYKCAEGVKLINMVNNEYYTQDRNMCGCRGVYNGVMICKKNDIRLLKAIHTIVLNVKHKFYGKSSLVPTGPGLLGKIFTSDEYDNTSLQFVADNTTDASGHTNHKIIEKKTNKVIFIMYDEYREEQSKYSKTHPHYEKLWQSRNIYY